jgi:hypothetical protein
VVFGGNEIDVEFEVNWCFNPMFVVVLDAFSCW